MLPEFCIIIIKTIMNKKILLITLFISLIVNAQDKGNVTGLLTDKEYNNAPLPFANVQLKGTTIGTTTNARLSVPIPKGLLSVTDAKCAALCAMWVIHILPRFSKDL